MERLSVLLTQGPMLYSVRILEGSVETEWNCAGHREERCTLRHQPGTGATAVSASATISGDRHAAIRTVAGWPARAKGCITIWPR